MPTNNRNNRNNRNSKDNTRLYKVNSKNNSARKNDSTRRN